MLFSDNKCAKKFLSICWHYIVEISFSSTLEPSWSMASQATSCFLVHIYHEFDWDDHLIAPLLLWASLIRDGEPSAGVIASLLIRHLTRFNNTARLWLLARAYKWWSKSPMGPLPDKEYNRLAQKEREEDSLCMLWENSDMSEVNRPHIICW